MSKTFFVVDDVAAMLNCTKQTAYTVMKELNAELSEKGVKTMAGRISASYFNKRYGCTGGDSEDE